MTLCTVIIAQTPDNKFGYKDWPGKDGVIKHRIELPVTPFLGYELKSTSRFNDSIIYFRLPLSKEDTVKVGRLRIQIYPTIEKAQIALRDYMYTFQSTITPPRLIQDEFPYGDVAFGWEKAGALRVYFCNHNVMIIIEAIYTIELAAKIDSIIQAAPDWSSGYSKPAFIISKEFSDAFFVKTP
jgi:hypothetical protein